MKNKREFLINFRRIVMPQVSNYESKLKVMDFFRFKNVKTIFSSALKISSDFIQGFFLQQSSTEMFTFYRVLAPAYYYGANTNMYFNKSYLLEMFWRLLNFQILLSSVNTVETKTEKHKNSSAKLFNLFEQENLQRMQEKIHNSKLSSSIILMECIL